MDNRKQALTDLLAKVEAGDNAGFRKANRAVFSTPCQDMALQLREEHSRHAYKGSLDAAMALHEAVLPNYNIGLMNKVNTGKWSALVYPKGPKIAEWVDNETPARAWLMAIIKALIAKGTE